MDGMRTTLQMTPADVPRRAGEVIRRKGVSHAHPPTSDDLSGMGDDACVTCLAEAKACSLGSDMIPDTTFDPRLLELHAMIRPIP